MKIIAAIVMNMPVTTFRVMLSPKAIAPTRMAVTGSNTPRTEALVAPIILVAMARVAVDTIVGNMASPARLAHDPSPCMPESRGVRLAAAWIENTITPVSNA